MDVDNLPARLARRLQRGRAMAAARMPSRATVRRRTGTAPGPDGFDVDVYDTILTSVPFRLGGSERGGSGSRTLRVGESEIQVAVRVGHFTAPTVGLADGDLIDVVDGENAGAVLRILEASWADQQTALRVPVVEEQRPAAWG